MNLREVLARNLRLLRNNRGLSQEALGDLAGFDRTYVSSLERCKYSVSIDIIEKIANVLDVEPHILLQRELPGDLFKTD